MKKVDYSKLFPQASDGRYYYRWTDENGVRHKLSSNSAEELWHKVNAPKPTTVTFSEAARAWQAFHFVNIAFKTSEAYRAPLKRLTAQFGERDVKSITSMDITAYLKTLATQEYSRRSVQMHRDILSMIFNKAIVDGAVQFNPCDAVTLPRNLRTTQRTLPDDDAIKAVRSERDHPFRLFAQICLYSGLRRGEVLALQFDDIDRQRGVIHVTKAIEFVGNRPHVGPTKTEAGERDAILLDALAELIPNGRGYIFPSADGGPLSKSSYFKRWRSYCKTIGYDITAHQLRHGFATMLYEAGIADKDAQELLGHANITTTRNVYTHIRQAHRLETAATLNAFVSR